MVFQVSSGGGLNKVTEGDVIVLSVGTTPVQVGDKPTVIVVIKADDDNSGNIYLCVNNSACTTSNGFRLKAGQALTIEIDNLNKLYLVADSDGQKAYVVWLR